jgi:hypothetical protein
MSEQTLQQVLTTIGFIDVTGTTELCGGTPYIVPLAPPDKRKRWDFNNAAFAIIDECGHSWVISRKVLSLQELNVHDTITRPFGLTEGCHVPHSNDGGLWTEQTWPWAYKKS